MSVIVSTQLGGEQLCKKRHQNKSHLYVENSFTVATNFKIVVKNLLQADNGYFRVKRPTLHKERAFKFKRNIERLSLL